MSLKEQQKTTTHRIYFRSAGELSSIDDDSVNLVVTSPPYPMIEMWDAAFSREDRKIASLLVQGKGKEAFDRMHIQLDAVWEECYRVLKNGSFACINIGDATRKVGEEFRLYPNHARILSSCLSLGFEALPLILWRKQTNAPNKFMGSGMLPAGAYVTLEHEYILVLRKGGKRQFITDEDKRNRRESALFWEERNTWFSDVWDFKGTRQDLPGKGNRNRSGAFPFELAARLICMYSVKRDVVLDPFLGTGTTTAASLACGRNSIGIEIDETLKPAILERLESCGPEINRFSDERIQRHLRFLEEERWKDKCRHINSYYGFHVMTRQEVELVLDTVHAIERRENYGYLVRYGTGVPVFSENTCFTEEKQLPLEL